MTAPSLPDYVPSPPFDAGARVARHRALSCPAVLLESVVAKLSRQCEADEADQRHEQEGVVERLQHVSYRRRARRD